MRATGTPLAKCRGSLTQEPHWVLHQAEGHALSWALRQNHGPEYPLPGSSGQLSTGTGELSRSGMQALGSQHGALRSPEDGCSTAWAAAGRLSDKSHCGASCGRTFPARCHADRNKLQVRRVTG